MRRHCREPGRTRATGVNTLIIQGFHEKGFRAGKPSQAVKAGGPLLTLEPAHMAEQRPDDWQAHAAARSGHNRRMTRPCNATNTKVH